MCYNLILKQYSHFFGVQLYLLGNSFWRYDTNTDPPVSRNYPFSIRSWSRLLAGGINAAFQWENNSTYFFKGDQYYRYNDRTHEVSNLSNS